MHCVFCEFREAQLTDNIPAPQTSADHWIMSKLGTLITETEKDYAAYNFGQIGEKLYSFAWHDFADWYIEIAKKQEDTENTNNVLGFVLAQTLKLLHPFTPFITEAIWKERGMNTLLMVQELPSKKIAQEIQNTINQQLFEEFTQMQEKIIKERKVNDLEKNKEKYQKELSELITFINGIEKKLNNEKFVQNAPPQVIELEKKKYTDFVARKEALEKLLSE